MDLLAAILLINGAPGTPEPQPTQAEYFTLQPHIHRVALAWEILDAREQVYIFVKPAEFQSDLDILRRRNIELRDAPRICEAEKLPPRPWVSELCSFNRAYKSHLERRRGLERDREEILSAAICETDALYRVLDNCRDARADFYFVHVRRQALMRLRDALGEDDWAAVRMPPCVPYWRFEE